MMPFAKTKLLSLWAVTWADVDIMLAILCSVLFIGDFLWSKREFIMAFRGRIVVGLISLTAAGIVGIWKWEDYRSEAYIPVPGDVPTLGVGTTEGVKMGDKTTFPKAIERSLKDVEKFEGALRRCVTVPLHQHEYDAYVSFMYNVGEGAFCSSTLVRRLNSGDYEGACAALSDWVCGPANEQTRAKPGTRCYSPAKPMQVYKGLENRRAQERATCEGK